MEGELKLAVIPIPGKVRSELDELLPSIEAVIAHNYHPILTILVDQESVDQVENPAKPDDTDLLNMQKELFYNNIDNNLKSLFIANSVPISKLLTLFYRNLNPIFKGYFL